MLWNLPVTRQCPGRWAGALIKRWVLRLPGLAVDGVFAVTRAELLQLDAVRVVAAVLLGDVVALFALRTRLRDLRTNVGRLGHGEVPSFRTGNQIQRTSIAAHTDGRPIGRPL